MLLPSHLRSADITTETGEVRDINRWFSELINRIADEKDAEIERLKECYSEVARQFASQKRKHEDARQELTQARVEIERLNAELATLRAKQPADHAEISRLRDLVYDRDAAIEALRDELVRVTQPPAPGPQEPAESPIDKAAREAWGRRYDELTDHHVWESLTEVERNGWRRVVAPFVGVKEELPRPVKSDGTLFEEAIQSTPNGDGWSSRAAALFLAKRAERDGTTTDNRKAV